MKILVTGAAGFIGSHLCEELHNIGYEVVGLDNFSNYYNVELKKINQSILEKKYMKIHTIDLRNNNELSSLTDDFDYIYHLAAQPGIAAHVTFDEYLTNNVIATQNLINFAKLNKSLKQFINVSTSSVYGLHATADENTETKPASNYGVTKLAAEQLVLSNARNEFLNACSVRLYSVFGPRERPDKMFSKLIDCALNSKAFTLFEGSELHLRSFTYVKDVVKGMSNLIGLENITNKEIFNIGSQLEHTTLDCIKIVENLTNSKIKLKLTPKRVGDQQRTCAIIDKAQKVFSYETRYSIEDGVSEQIKYL